MVTLNYISSLTHALRNGITTTSFILKKNIKQKNKKDEGSLTKMLHTFCAYCWEYFARNLHVCNLLFNVNLHMCKLQKTYKELGICAEYAHHQIYIFCIYAKYVQNTKYAECMHFAHMHSARMLHMCIVHIIILRFAHILYICQLHASFIYALCFNDIIINYVMHNNAQD